MKNQHIIRRTVVSLALLLLAVVAQAQIKSVSGTVSDNFGPLMGASVCEVDGNNRIIEAAVTDINGNFSMKIKNPKDRLRISYIGNETQFLPINRSVYKINMSSKTTIKEVTVTAKKKAGGSGLAIPQREVSAAMQTISTKEFEGLGVTSIDEALQGRIAGLDIIANSGNLGSGTTMRLRGQSSISTAVDANPLIVVNGNVQSVDLSNFDMNSANDETFAQLLNINPEDIKEISVLKDAAATAIWGSQGSNGVIEITTKRGTRGKPRVSYSLRLTGTHQPSGTKLLNGDDYTMLLKESYFNPKQLDAASNISEINYDKTFSEYEQYNNNTDWRKAVTQFGLRQNHYLSVTGGGEKATFRIAGGYDRETGSVIKQKLDRFSTRVALDYYVSDRIKISTDFALTYTNNQKNYDNLLSIAYKKMPNMGIYEEDANGNPTSTYYEMLQSASSVFDGNQKSLVNPVASANLAKNNERTYSIQPQFEIEYNLLGLDDDSWRLRWNGRVNMDIFNDYVDQFYPSELKTVSWHDGVNNAYTASSKSVGFNTRQTLTLIPHFNNEDHSLMAMARMDLGSGNSNWQNTTGYGLASGGIESPNAGGRISGMSSGFSQWRSLYFLFSAHYAYKGRYMFDFTIRRDGTTKFGPNRRWGNFPSVSARWNISDEPFMKGTRSWLSMLSIRPSWGIVGGQPSSDYLYESKYATSAKYLDGNAIQPSNIKLTDLRWQKKKQWNIGSDIGLFDNRITIAVEVYKTRTTDMLMSGVRIPSSTGYGTLPYMNVGTLDNKGWELNLNTNKLVQKGKFWMDVNATIGNNKNNIVEMESTVLETLNTKFNYENGSYLQRVQVNNPFGALYGFRYKGVYQYNYETISKMSKAEQQAYIDQGKTAPVALNSEGKIIYGTDDKPLQMMYNYSNTGSGKDYKFKGGDAIYEDINHDGNIDALDIVYLGSSLPKFNGGFGFTFHYDQWKLNTQFTYRYGNDILNLARLDNEAMVTNYNQSQAVNYRWRKEGDVTSIPRAMYGSNTNYNSLVSDRFVEDGSYLRLNYIQLSYALKQKVAKKIGLRGLHFYLSANNLFILTKYTGVDPEVSYTSYGLAIDNLQTPRARSYTFGMTVDF